jgi:hypothetical protein
MNDKETLGAQMGSSPCSRPDPNDTPRISAERPVRRSIAVNVVAYLNLTRHDGAIAFIHPLPDCSATTTTGHSPATLRTTVSGVTIAEYPARLLPNRKASGDDDETAIIDVVIDVDVGATIQLVLNGVVIDTFDPGRQQGR